MGYESKTWFGCIELKEWGVLGERKSFKIKYPENSKFARRYVTVIERPQRNLILIGETIGEDHPRRGDENAWEAIWTGREIDAFDWLIQGCALDDMNAHTDRKSPA